MAASSVVVMAVTGSATRCRIKERKSGTVVVGIGGVNGAIWQGVIVGVGARRI